MIPIPEGVLPIRSLTTNEILYGTRVTSYRWEILQHVNRTDRLIGYLDGVVEGSASLLWALNATVKGSGSLKVVDLRTATPGYLKIQDITLPSARLRPVLCIQGLPEIPLGIYLISSVTESWTEAGRQLNIDLLDRTTVLSQDSVDASFTAPTTTPILAIIANIIQNAGETITMDNSVTNKLVSPLVWPAGTPKIRIINELLNTLHYNSLWVDGQGTYQATPYILPANRSTSYELLNGLPRELIDGETSIYSNEWARDVDFFDVPNRVIAVQSSRGDKPALTGRYQNTDPASPYSYPNRGRWITRTLDNVEVPDGTDDHIRTALNTKARQSLIAASAVQATITVKHLPIPIRVSDTLQFANTPANINERYTITAIKLDANPLGLMHTTLQEVINL